MLVHSHCAETMPFSAVNSQHPASCFSDILKDVFYGLHSTEHTASSIRLVVQQCDVQTVQYPKEHLLWA